MPELSGDLLEFYGTECHFCIKMAPLLERLEKEEHVKVVRIEVWHNADKGLCGGVPFFFNRRTGAWICGYANYDKLKEWALGK